MPPERRQAESGFEKHGPGIFQGSIATALTASLYFAVKLGSEHIFHIELQDWVAPIAYWIAVVVVFPVMWLLTRFATRSMRITPPPKGNRLSIYVARFGEDELSEEFEIE